MLDVFDSVNPISTPCSKMGDMASTLRYVSGAVSGRDRESELCWSG